ncbi:MAG: XdhC family protein [Thermodesulfobacteriota bacterium]
MLEVWRRLMQELVSGRPAALGTIIRQAGSSPRSLGTKFLVRRDGSLVGSIGGGMLEARVIEAALALMGRRTARVLEIRMTGAEVAGTDMICGGRVDVLVQALTPESGGDREVLEQGLRVMEKGGRGLLGLGPLPEPSAEREVELFFLRPGAGMTRPTGTSAGPGPAEVILSQAERLLAAGTLEILDTPAGRYLVEPLVSIPTAVVFGGGHISVHLAPLLHLVGFKVIVVDDRAEFASPGRFPQAAGLVVADFKTCFENLEITPETYAVIVTRGHLHDQSVLREVLARDPRYVGMIGSRRKIRMIFQSLLGEGVDPDRIGRVHSPIGLDIGAETPEEIAVSITAEMIKVRAGNLKKVKDWEV